MDQVIADLGFQVDSPRVSLQSTVFYSMPPISLLRSKDGRNDRASFVLPPEDLWILV